MVDSWLRASNCVSPISVNGASVFGCSSASVNCAAASADLSTEEMNEKLAILEKNSTVSPTLSALIVFTHIW